MTNIDSLTPTQDERLMAALAHISAIMPLMGIIAPIVIWITQKEKSQYAAFQALQALAFQLSMVLAWFIGMGCYMLSFFATFVPLFMTSSSSSTAQPASPIFPLAVIIPFLVFGLMFLGAFIFIVYGIIGAVMAFQGKPFRYIILGKFVERFMQANRIAGAS